ncbi:MAG TPA: hypothetical protein VE011_04715 [Candidatus Dormibacteraeota bacterium]|nr:hypothetical protein [Candidatus Dormibacteraeota bacterium]
MRPSTKPRSGTLAATLVSMVLAAAACSPNQSPPASGPAGSPGASTTAACQTAPSVPDGLAGWAAPATPPAVTPIIIASPGELVCGSNRILFTFIDANSRPLGAPNRPARVAFFDLARDPNTPISTRDGTFVWAIENERGDYIVNQAFTEAGRYGAEFTFSPDGSSATPIRLTFDVQPSSPVVKVGDHAPASRTPTLADVGGDVTHISSDATPDPAFYQTSVAQALAAHQPFVLIFATPKFCVSAQCGPTLDRIKPYVTKYPTVTFINVEPYKLKLVGGDLQADTDASGQLQSAPATDEWHLLSEPNVFVVNRDGIVTANFELIFSDAELTAALDAIK